MAGFSHTGKSHEADGLDNQDSCTFLLKGNACVLVVSDGAGSASKAKIGSSTLVSTIEAGIRKAPDILFEEPVEKLDLLSSVVETAIEQARGRLLESPRVFGSLFKKKKNDSIHAYSATLVMVVSGGAQSAVFHIGDGYAGSSYFDENGRLVGQYLSCPQNGQFDNETYFYTDDDWRHHFRVTAVDAKVNYIFAMTDGADPFMIGHARQNLDDRVNTRLFDLLGSDQQIDLAQVFTKEKVHAVSHDDSTLLVGRL